jgi:hypothetical protein
VTVRREHGEAVEPRRIRDALEARAVDVDAPDVELAPLGVTMVRGEQDALSGGVPERREGGGVEVRELRGIGAVGIGDVELELRRANEVLREQLLEVLEVLALGT